ncbi:hypothetical protein [Biostraticola tofi]|uniref:hypothetical protein n=1 Tax=Biostraticola tofi TaxID=466109 RepID=UPI001045D1A9|nr:hypothetical protein [Biostraticola tofi]
MFQVNGIAVWHCTLSTGLGGQGNGREKGRLQEETRHFQDENWDTSRMEIVSWPWTYQRGWIA